MKMRKLGHSDLEIAPLMLGGNVFGWTVDEQNSFKILDAFLDEGFNAIDTADVYSFWVPGNQGGESETVLGKWMKARGNRSRVVIATKVGMEMPTGERGLSKSRIFEAVEESLQRLQTDYIDLYQSHQDDPQTPVEETLQAYTELIQQGKVRVIGASNFTAERLSESAEASARTRSASYQTLQPLYNLYDRAAFEANLLPVCRAQGISVIPYYALASGFLSGKVRKKADLEGRARKARLEHYLSDRGLRILTALDKVAARHATVPATVAVAWVASRPGITAPISSATNVDQLKELTAAIRLKLDPESLRELEAASAG